MAMNFKNERKKKKKYALNIRGVVWSWKKMKSCVLQHDIPREFEIRKSIYYRFIFKIAEKFAETEVFINYFLCFNCFHFFLL